MKDIHIRQLLRQTELRKYIADPDSKVVDELQLPVAMARVDIAVINGHLHGYEIKSSSDTLKRLPAQLEAYAKVFDYITVVTGEKHHEHILNMAPAFVGVSVCSNDGVIYEKRPASINETTEGFYIAKLLWHDELVEVLTSENIPFKKKSRNWILCETLAKHLHVSRLSKLVRQKLKARPDWKIKEGYVIA